MKAYEKKQAILVTEFDRYVVEHLDFAAQIPPGAQVVIQVEGDDAFNEWARRLADGQREAGQPAVYATVVRRTNGMDPLAAGNVTMTVKERFGAGGGFSWTATHCWPAYP